jgi:hypothetical protein
MRALARCCFAIACWLSVGCGGGGAVSPTEPTLVNFLAEFEVALADATGTVRSAKAAATTSGQRSEGEAAQDDDPPEIQIRGAMQMLKSSADQLALSAAGHPAESDVKTIQSDTAALLQKAQGVPNASEMLQGLQQLTAKAESLKSKL